MHAKNIDSNVSIKVLEYINYEKTLLVDLRDKEKYIKGHIPYSINMKEEDIYNSLHIFSQYEAVYLYCDYGNKGMYVTKMLKERYHLNNVFNIVGGYNVYRGRIEKNIAKDL